MAACDCILLTARNFVNLKFLVVILRLVGCNDHEEKVLFPGGAICERYYFSFKLSQRFEIQLILKSEVFNLLPLTSFKKNRTLCVP